MDYSEKWGTSVDEAVDLALFDLKATRDQVEITILEEPSKGFFGIGNKLAKVRVEIKKEATKPEKTVEKIVEKAVEKAVEVEKRVEKTLEKTVERAGEKIEQIREIPERRREIKPLLQEKPEDLKEVTDHPALTFLRETIEAMGLDLQASGMANEEYIFINLAGEDSGTIIGKRGQTLDALQYLTGLVINKNKENYTRVVIDSESYRSKREKTLQQLADRLGDKVVKNRRSVKLEPMNPYERKVIHSTLQNNPKVVTRSEGEEPYRRVVIELKRKG
ncbi:MAG: RNA-binding cell elongation regulator Jag/EloR [Anaerovoracaceae bacterium]|jgi:spoIIIJ-associated protein|nr:RNA-binding cell elongation regulator Jag/EloR [Anaerovoracaceae bacterium]